MCSDKSIYNSSVIFILKQLNLRAGWINESHKRQISITVPDMFNSYRTYFIWGTICYNPTHTIPFSGYINFYVQGVGTYLLIEFLFSLVAEKSLLYTNCLKS